MSAEIVNLRRARKAKARIEKERTAATNRAAFGRTKGQREIEAQDKARAARVLDGARRQEDGAPAGGDDASSGEPTNERMRGQGAGQRDGQDGDRN